MGTVEIRAEVHNMIDRLDEGFLKVVYAMLETYERQQKEDPIVGYDIEGLPLYASVAKAEYARRVAAMKDGQSTTIEELRKESEEW